MSGVDSFCKSPRGGAEKRRSDAPAEGGIEGHAETLRLLAAVLERLDALHADVRVLLGRPRGKLQAGDADRLVCLLTAAHAAVGSAPWTCADLVARAVLPGGSDLARVLADPRLAGQSMQRFGKFCARVAGHDAGGLVLRRVGADRGVTLWSVVRG